MATSAKSHTLALSPVIARPVSQSISSKVSVIGAESERLSENQIGIRFFADGSATGGEIELALADQLFSIEIDWLTGLARIQR